jgi:hypothetical protein
VESSSSRGGAKRSRTKRTVLGAIGLLALVPAAQAAPGDHIRAGDAIITPSVMTGLEYHSNVYLEDGYREPIVGAPAWVVSPRAKVDLDRPDWKFEFGAGYTLKIFFDTAPKDGINVPNLNQYSNFDANLGLNGLTRSLVGFRLEDRFEIKNSPAETQTAEGNSNIVTTSNDLNGGLVVRPGSALEIGLLGQVGFDNYNIPEALLEEGTNPNLNNRINYGPILDAKWQFLPKTALISTTSLNWNRWNDNLVSALGPDTGVDYGEYLGKPNSIIWKTLWGVKGQVTPKIAVQLQAGYGQAWYDEATVLDEAGSLPASSAELDLTGVDQNSENFARDLKSFKEGLLLNTQVSWAPVSGQNVILGYRKDFQDAFFTNYVAFNYLFFRYEGVYGKRVGATGEVTYRLDGYHGEVHRLDSNVAVKVAGAYRITDWLSTGLSAGWSERACADANCGGDQFYNSQYDDFWGQVGITFTY